MSSSLKTFWLRYWVRKDQQAEHCSSGCSGQCTTLLDGKERDPTKDDPNEEILEIKETHIDG